LVDWILIAPQGEIAGADHSSGNEALALHQSR
jgi:hypothetical protein